MSEWKNEDGSVSWLKRKHTSLKTKGRYSGGPRPAPLKKRVKKGAKTYVYGSHVMRLLPNGKTVMEKAVV